MPTTGEFSLYLHLPFCLKKCPYCHFYSVYPTPVLTSNFKKALLIHLDQLDFQGSLVSVYFGGGTPALLEVDFFAEILQKIKTKFKLTKKAWANLEITLETNPQTIHEAKLKAFKTLGINRLSIGVQSFQDHLLQTLGRSHSAQEAIASIKCAKKTGFENISIDLMYDIPNQTRQDWLESLNLALTLPITHLSLYNLTFEENTPFFQKKETLLPLLPSEKDALFCLKTACQKLKQAGFKRYEISAFGKKGFFSKHNLGYWTGRSFMGLGPSAFSFDQKKREQNSPALKTYLKKIFQQESPVSFSEELPYPSNLKERLAINLRVLRGVDLKNLQNQVGSFTPETLQSIDKLKKMGLLQEKENQLKLTSKGVRFYDLIAEELI